MQIKPNRRFDTVEHVWKEIVAHSVDQPAQTRSLEPPGTPPPPPDELNKTIVVSIDKAGTLKINQKEVELRYLGNELQDVFKTRNDRTMFVQADPDLLYKDVVEVIDVAKGAGVDKVGLMTEQISAASGR